MEYIPNEIIRMMLEHLTYEQRIAIQRISAIWRYLVATFKKQYPHEPKQFKNLIIKKLNFETETSPLNLRANELAEYLLINSLTYLNLRANSVGNEGLIQLAKCLKTNSAL